MFYNRWYIRHFVSAFLIQISDSSLHLILLQTPPWLQSLTPLGNTPMKAWRWLTFFLRKVWIKLKFSTTGMTIYWSSLILKQVYIHPNKYAHGLWFVIFVVVALLDCFRLIKLGAAKVCALGFLVFVVVWSRPFMFSHILKYSFTGTGAVVWSPSQWRHNERDGVSNHRCYDCLLNRLFGCGSKKTSKLRVTGLCEGNSPVTGEFPSQRASSAENASIWWRHHVPRANEEPWRIWLYRAHECIKNTIRITQTQGNPMYPRLQWPLLLTWINVNPAMDK